MSSCLSRISRREPPSILSIQHFHHPWVFALLADKQMQVSPGIQVRNLIVSTGFSTSTYNHPIYRFKDLLYPPLCLIHATVSIQASILSYKDYSNNLLTSPPLFYSYFFPIQWPP